AVELGDVELARRIRRREDAEPGRRPRLVRRVAVRPVLVALIAIRRTERVPQRPGTHLRERARQRRLDDVLLELRVVLKLCLDRVDAVLRDLELAHDRQSGRARRDTAGEARPFGVALSDESLAEIRRLDDSAP